jgi:hypothetical protein
MNHSPFIQPEATLPGRAFLFQCSVKRLKARKNLVADKFHPVNLLRG